MPTGPNNDLVPVRRGTKRALAAAKGEASFDEAIRALLDEVPPEALRYRLAVRRMREAAGAVPRPPDLGTGTGRSAEKQTQIAELAEVRWRLWAERGVVERIGPRRFRYRPPAPTGVIPTVRRPGRGRPA